MGVQPHSKQALPTAVYASGAGAWLSTRLGLGARMRPVSTLCAAALLFGCEASIDVHSLGAPGSPGNPGSPPTDPCLNAPANVPSSLLVRMTGPQLRNTERTLFAAPTFTAPLEDGTTDVISQLEVQKINDAAAAIVALGHHYTYATCDVTGAGSAQCATDFINAFGQKAFHRPLTTDEVTWLMGVYSSTLAIAGMSPAITFQEAIDVVAQTLIQSPQHIYISAQGVDDATLPAGLRRMTGYERATRLSYMITNNMPDDTILAAAAAGTLDTPDGMRTQAQRMLDSDDGHTMVKAFGSAYAGINASNTLPALENLPKDLVKFPYDSPALRTAMRTETEAFYEHVFYGTGGSFNALQISTDAYVNKGLATLYGVSGGPADDATFSWVQLDGTQRAGIFTRAAFLAENANQDYESLIRRGVHTFKQTLCQNVPPPPPNVNNVPPTPMATNGMAESVRQQTEDRTSPAFCNSCHQNFNTIGYTLGNYDAMGAWQTSEQGTDSAGNVFSVPIDATATIPTSDLQGTVTGGTGLSQKLAASPTAQGCMAQQWFSVTMGRGPAPEDQCTVAALSSTFESKKDMNALVLDVVTSAPSLYVRHDM